jgi:hypothetical protein
MRWNKKGQVTIFIIIAILIVFAAVLLYLFYPQITTTLGSQEETPQTYIQTCMEKEISTAVDTLSLQGGSFNVTNYLMYNDSKVEYLCYTNEYYRPCLLQQPMLKQHIEKEIKTKISNSVNKCFGSLKTDYEKQGYTAELKNGGINVELLPKRVISTFNYTLTTTRGDVEKYDSFVVILNNNLYELTSIANSILQWESTYGDAEVTAYMTYYHDLKVEKVLRESGEKIYIITDRNTGNKFQFASRSQMWPPGIVTPNKG